MTIDQNLEKFLPYHQRKEALIESYNSFEKSLKDFDGFVNTEEYEEKVGNILSELRATLEELDRLEEKHVSDYLSIEALNLEKKSASFRERGGLDAYDIREMRSAHEIFRKRISALTGPLWQRLFACEVIYTHLELLEEDLDDSPDSWYRFIHDLATKGFHPAKEVLGTGGFGVVTKKRLKDSEIACKSENSPKRPKHEYRMLLSCSHPNIISPIALRQDRVRNNLELYMELGEGTLSDFKDRASPGELLHFFEDVLKALSHLEEKNIVHYDLKPENILIIKGEAKLCDFGLADFGGKHIEQGTYPYRAPENQKDNYDDSPKNDVWALGVTLFNTLRGNAMFPIEPYYFSLNSLVRNGSDGKKLRKVLECDEIPAQRDPTGKLRNLMERCLEPNPHERPSASRLLAEFFM